jgi:hypothetical protein
MGAEILDLQGFRLARAAAQVSSFFKTRLDVTVTEKTSLADLPDSVVAFLVDTQPAPTEFLHQCIIRVLGMGRGVGFDYLEGEAKMRVLDVYLYLLDQLRFECLYRLKWLGSFPARDYPLLLMMISPATVKAEAGRPVLSADHPDYEEFMARREVDGEVVIRRLIPDAVAAFRAFY